MIGITVCPALNSFCVKINSSDTFSFERGLTFPAGLIVLEVTGIPADLALDCLDVVFLDELLRPPLLCTTRFSFLSLGKLKTSR